MFEVFGHMQHSKKEEVRSPVTPAPGAPLPRGGTPLSPAYSSEVTQSYSLLTHVQICELSPAGDYVPVPVLHRDNIPTGSMHLLQQVGSSTPQR